MKNIFLLLLLISCSSKPIRPPNKMEALAVAEKIFRRMDKGFFQKIYHDSSGIFKDHLTVKDWERSFLYKKMIFGKKIKRNKTRDALVYNIRSFPEGVYTEIDYETHYAKRGHTRERLILRWENEKWRVCGYTIL